MFLFKVQLVVFQSLVGFERFYRDYSAFAWLFGYYVGYIVCAFVLTFSATLFYSCEELVDSRWFWPVKGGSSFFSMVLNGFWNGFVNFFFFRKEAGFNL